jgi:Holliday junction resolvase RusA-like endonuclease
MVREVIIVKNGQRAVGTNAVLKFTVPSKPVPKARARVMRGGWTYTPKKSNVHEKLVKMVALNARQRAKQAILGGFVRLEVICYGAHARSDWDNLGKLVSDALNGVLWNDDSQVLDACVKKFRCPKGQERTEVMVSEMSL